LKTYLFRQAYRIREPCMQSVLNWTGLEYWTWQRVGSASDAVVVLVALATAACECVLCIVTSVISCRLHDIDAQLITLYTARSLRTEDRNFRFCVQVDHS